MKSLIAFLISATIAIPVLAMPPGDSSHMLKGLTRHLELTQEQQTQAQAILDSKKPQMEALRKKMKALREETNGEIKAILSEEQVVKFEAMQERRKERFEKKRYQQKHKIN